MEKQEQNLLDGEPRRFCRKCLLREMPEQAFFENLTTYIRQIDADQKVSDEIYEQRLNQCRQCDKLLNGMCRICGCYVELRAVMKKNECPCVVPLWKKSEENYDY